MSGDYTVNIHRVLAAMQPPNILHHLKALLVRKYIIIKIGNLSNVTIVNVPFLCAGKCMGKVVI